MKPVLKAPGTKRLIPSYDNSPSSFAFNFNMRRYTPATYEAGDGAASGGVIGGEAAHGMSWAPPALAALRRSDLATELRSRTDDPLLVALTAGLASDSTAERKAALAALRHCLAGAYTRPLLSAQCKRFLWDKVSSDSLSVTETAGFELRSGRVYAPAGWGPPLRTPARGWSLWPCTTRWRTSPRTWWAPRGRTWIRCTRRRALQLRRGQGLMDSARQVKGCQFIQETRVHNAFDLKDSARH